MAAKIGLFFGSSTGCGEGVASQIKEIVEATGVAEVDIAVVSAASVKVMENFDYLILGASTWNIGELQDDWALKTGEMDSLKLGGRKVAMYGCGDQFGYSNSFVDALGIIGDKIIQAGGDLVAWWPDDEYEYECSRGSHDKAFMGLPVDNDNQPERTAQRVVNWTYWVLEEFGLLTPEQVAAAAE